MKSLLRRLPRSKSKSRKTEAANSNQDDLRVPRIDTADLKVCICSLIFIVLTSQLIVLSVEDYQPTYSVECCS